ncbi:MAG: hypothetical protein R3362_05600, partial [Rhodothermales bacterium]|nr:hypothetical protein [Rhodothermales bacterium]
MHVLLRVSSTIALVLVLAAPAFAQSTGNCRLGAAEAELDVAGVRAALYNTGNFFWDGGNPVYEVPKGSGLSPMFTANLWVGGLVEGELRIAATRYDNFEFWPGPLDDEGNPPADCSAYDRIWTVTRTDVERYVRSGQATPDLLEWPADLGAPTFDGDGV